MGFCWAKDRSGRVPFSVIAVAILVGSVATGAYMHQVSTTSGGGPGRSAGPSPDAIVPQLRLGLEQAAARSMAAAVDRQTAPGVDDGSQGLWRVDRSFREFFGQEIGRAWSGKRYDRYCLTVEAGDFELRLATFPATLGAINRLGMAVNMTVPAGFRAGGTVNFTFTTGGGQPVRRGVDFAVEMPSWYPLALFQADRLRRDCVNEGLVELLLREMLGGFLDTHFAELLARRNDARRAYPESTVTVGDLWKKRDLDEPVLNAVQLALLVEEQTLFGGRGGTLDFYYNLTPHRPLDVSAMMDYPRGGFSGCSAFSAGEDGGLELDLGPFHHGLTLSSVDGKGAGARLSPFVVRSLWIVPPLIELRRATFAGEDEMTDVYILEVTVNGVYRLIAGPDGDHLMRLDIPLHLQFTMDHRIDERDRSRSEDGRLHCEIEDLGLFYREYAGLYSTPVNLTLDIVNSSGVPARGMGAGCSVDLSLDGDYLGTFRGGEAGPGGLLLCRVPSGPHGLSVFWSGGGSGGSEHGSVTVVLEGADSAVRVRTEPRLSTSPFWTLALTYIRDAPAEQRLTRLVEFISLLAGHQPPGDPGHMPLATVENARFMEIWLAGLEDSLDSAQANPDLAPAAGAVVLEGALAVVKTIRETLRWMEKVGSAVDGYNRLHPAAPTGVEPTITYTGQNGAESLVLRAEGAFGGERLALERPAGSSGWSSSGTGREPGAGMGKAGPERLGAALDIAVTVTMVFSAYVKYVKYEATDGTDKVSERVDLDLEAIKLTLQVTRVLVKHVARSFLDNLAMGASLAGKLATALGVIIAAVTVLQMVSEESRKYRGDAAAWSALFTGLDLDTAVFHLSLTALALGVAELCFICLKMAAFVPVVAALMAVVALVLIVCIMVFDWNAFSTFVSGTLTDGDRDRMAGSIERTLRDTAGTVARLNEYPADAEMLSARQARGTASLLAGIASFTSARQVSLETRNLSRYQYDLAWAREHQARAVRSLRFFNIALWKQVDEFGGQARTALHPLRDQTWDSRITITWPNGDRSGIELDYIQVFLLGLNTTSLRDTGIDFEITGRVVVDRLPCWTDPLSRIGDQVTLWSGRLRASQEMKTFLYGLDSVRYRNDWGMLGLRLSPTYLSCNLEVTSGGPFDYQDGAEAGRAPVLRKTLTPSEETTYFYVEPGSYTLRFSGQEPRHELGLKNNRATVKVVDLYSPDFGKSIVGVNPRPEPIYFQVKNGFKGGVRVSVDVIDSRSRVVGALGTVFEDGNGTAHGGKQYIDDGWVPDFDFDGSMWGGSLDWIKSLALRIRFTVGLDRERDGEYELTRTRTVHVNDIRNDHVARMQSEDGKRDDQLGYYLTILDTPFRQKIGEDAEGNDLMLEQYLRWEKIG